MKPASPTIPLGKLGWLVLLAVIAAPTAFLLLVTPKEPDEEPAPPPAKRTLTKLESVGLRENRDWDGLPEMFAVWADKAEWKDDKTRIAFWHPSANRYSYFFEVARTSNGYRFKEVQPTEIDLFEAGVEEVEEGEEPLMSKAYPLLLLEGGHVIEGRPFQERPIRPAKLSLEGPKRVKIEMPSNR